MFVRNRMTASTVVAAADWTLAEACRTMEIGGCVGLPVMADGQIVGVITMEDILAHAFSADGEPTLSWILVCEVMVTEVVTVSPDEVIEVAAYLLRKHGIRMLPVVDDRGTLIGTVTMADVFSAFTDLLGLSERGTRITIRVEDRLGTLAAMTQALKQSHVGIASLATFPTEGAPTHLDVIVRLKTAEPKVAVDTLRRAGFRVLHVSPVWE